MTKIILASNSPRRKKILTDLGLDFEVIPSNYEEKLETDIFSYDLIEDLATQKACDVVRRVGHDEIVLGADTVVVLHNKILGKPKDKEDARRSGLFVNDIKTAKENAEINSISDKTEFIVGDLADKITDKYDIICANIVADIIIRLFDNVADYMNEGALLIISGIIDIRYEEVLNEAKKHGFKVVDSRVKDNWHAYVLKAEETNA